MTGRTARNSDHVLRRNERSLYMLGVRDDGEGIWLDRDQALRHVLAVGATGSGKTEFLIGLCINAIASGSGTLFVDGKGDVSTFARIYAAAAAFGRQHDVVLLNFSTPQTVGSVVASNTIDPIDGLTSEAVVQIIANFMHRATGDHVFWQDRFIGMMTLLVPAILWIRENVDRSIGLGRFGEFLTLDAVIGMSDASVHPGMPGHLREGVVQYLRSIPGYVHGQKKQGSTTNDQHGYLSMQALRVLSSIARDYGHVLSSRPGDVDMLDAVRSRRIVVVVLPALQKSEQEVRNVGRMIVSLLRNSMARSMELPVEGSWDRVSDPGRGTAAPHLLVLDEASQYLDAGMGVMAAQARSLGYALAFGVQSLDSLTDVRGENVSAGNAIVRNTATKVFMRSDVGRDYAHQNLLSDESRSDFGERDRPITKLRCGESAVRSEIRRMESIDRIRERYERLQPHQRRAIAGIGEFDIGRYVDLHDRAAAIERRIHDEYDTSVAENYWHVLPGLSTGEMVVSHGTGRIRGRAFWAGPDLKARDVRLVRSFLVDVDDREIDLRYDRKARLAKMVADLLDVPAHGRLTEAAERFRGIPDDAGPKIRIHRAFSLAAPPVPKRRRSVQL